MSFHLNTLDFYGFGRGGHSPTNMWSEAQTESFEQHQPHLVRIWPPAQPARPSVSLEPSQIPRKLGVQLPDLFAVLRNPPPCPVHESFSSTPAAPFPNSMFLHPPIHVVPSPDHDLEARPATDRSDHYVDKGNQDGEPDDGGARACELGSRGAGS